MNWMAVEMYSFQKKLLKDFDPLVRFQFRKKLQFTFHIFPRIFDHLFNIFKSICLQARYINLWNRAISTKTEKLYMQSFRCAH